MDEDIKFQGLLKLFIASVMIALWRMDQNLDNVTWNNDTVIKGLEQEQTFNHLGVNEGDRIRHGSIKEKLEKNT